MSASVQTISQPYIVAAMTEALELTPEEKILEIGTGSGYQAAVLAEIVHKVYSIEIVPELAEQAKEILERLNYTNVNVRAGDGYLGWPDEAPFDAIIVTAGAPEIPLALLSQLAPGGRMIVPVGSRDSQELIKLDKDEDGIHETNLGGCRFVKLIGEQGW